MRYTIPQKILLEADERQRRLEREVQLNPSLSRKLVRADARSGNLLGLGNQILNDLTPLHKLLESEYQKIPEDRHKPKFIDELLASWNEFKEQHPLEEIKEVVQTLGAKRERRSDDAYNYTGNNDYLFEGLTDLYKVRTFWDLSGGPNAYHYLGYGPGFIPNMRAFIVQLINLMRYVTT